MVSTTVEIFEISLLTGFQFPQGVLVPIHARMVSVQPLETKEPPKPAPEPACVVQ